MIKASVYWINPSSKVAYVIPTMAVDMVTPSMGVTYAFPVMDAILDVRGLHFNINDVLQVQDSYTAEVQKTEEDLVLFEDESSWELELDKQETVYFNDLFNRLCLFQRTFNENVVIGDAASLSVAKWFYENLGITDSVSIVNTKALDDGVTFQESLFEKTLTQSKSDSINISDSFFLTTNDYSDLTYFAEEYVGVTRTV